MTSTAHSLTYHCVEEKAAFTRPLTEVNAALFIGDTMTTEAEIVKVS